MSASKTGRRFWPVEVWLESREIFKALVRDTLAFLFVVAVLAAGHWLIQIIGLSGDQQSFLERWHFRLTVAVWILLSCFLIVEICIGLWLRIWDQIKNARK